MSHTPGPWMVTGQRQFGARIVTNGAGDWIADAGEADARLIASAPDLLAALEEIEELPNQAWAGYDRLFSRIHQIGSAAINKAAGTETTEPQV